MILFPRTSWDLLGPTNMKLIRKPMPKKKKKKKKY